MNKKIKSEGNNRRLTNITANTSASTTSKKTETDSIDFKNKNNNHVHLNTNQRQPNQLHLPKNALSEPQNTLRGNSNINNFSNSSSSEYINLTAPSKDPTYTVSTNMDKSNNSKHKLPKIIPAACPNAGNNTTQQGNVNSNVTSSTSNVNLNGGRGGGNSIAGSSIGSDGFRKPIGLPPGLTSIDSTNLSIGRMTVGPSVNRPIKQGMLGFKIVTIFFTFLYGVISYIYRHKGIMVYVNSFLTLQKQIYFGQNIKCFYKRYFYFGQNIKCLAV